MARSMVLDPEKVWALREARGLSQPALAKKAKLGQSSVHRMETMVGQPFRWREILKLAGGLEVEVTALGVSEEDAARIRHYQATIKTARRVLPKKSANGAVRHRDGNVKSESGYRGYIGLSGYRKETGRVAASVL